MDAAAENQDKHDEALNRQRFQMLEDIAAELSGEVVFPTCFDVALRVRNALQAPDASLGQIASVLGTEPLLTARLLQAANSAAVNTGGPKITSIESALGKLGLNAARSAAMAVAMEQLLQSRELSVFAGRSREIWSHSLLCAAAARVLAQRLTRVNPEEALLAGLVHDLGAFYLLYRAARYPELVARPASLDYLIAQWHGSIGETLLHALALPESVIDAVRENDNPRTEVTTLRSLTDVMFVANLLAGGLSEMQRQDIGEIDGRPELENPVYTGLMEEIRSVRQSFTSTM